MFQQGGLKKILGILQEANSCLKYSDRGSVEGNIFQFATKAMAQCQETLALFDFMVKESYI